MGKWTDWYNSLDPATQAWINKQPIYTSNEMNWTMLWCFVVGVIVGLAF